MTAIDNIHQRVRQAATQRLLFLPHTIRQMSRLDRMITTTEVETVIMTGEVIEDYPEDVRGHSCLILGFGQRCDLFMLSVLRKMSIWQSLPRIFLIPFNGHLILKRG